MISRVPVLPPVVRCDDRTMLRVVVPRIGGWWPTANEAATTRSIRLVRGDLAQWQADALAVSANPYLEGTSRASHWRFAGRQNADGSVRQAGGAALASSSSEAAARAGVPLAPGRAITSRAGGVLRADWIVHVVAPDALLEQPPERSALLRQTYDAALDAAAAKGCRSLALPAIGCGIRGFPPEEAAKAAFDAAAAWLTFQDGDRRHGQLSRVDFVVYSDFVAHHWWPCALSSFGTALEHAALLDDALAVDLAPGGLVWRYRGGA